MPKSALSFLFAAFLAFAPMAVFASLAGSPPPAVVDEITKLEKECRDNPADSRPLQTKMDIVESADLNGDGMQDYIFYDDSVVCDIGASFRHGNGGTGIIVFAGTKEGAEKAFEMTAFGYRLDKKGSGAKAYITVGGHYCGQDDSKSRADAVSCERALAWDAKTRRFDLAPLK